MLRALMYLFQLYHGHVNVCMGGIGLNQERTNILRQLFPHHYTSFVLAGIIAKPYTSLEKLYIPFTVKTWYTLGLFVLSVAIFIVWLKIWRPTWKFLILQPNNDAPFLGMLALLLGLPVGRPAHFLSGRLILTVFTLTAMVLRNSYQGVLFNLLQQQNIHQLPATIDDLVEDNYSILVNPRSKHLYSSITSKKVQGM